MAYSFRCDICGKEYGPDVISLAVHIGREHDGSRG